jgi:hypothetical protein
MRALKAVCCAAALVVCFTPRARADEWNKKTYLTFIGPVQIPGTTLPAGTYMFELADPDTSRHVVRVSSQDGAKTFGLFMTIPNDRLQPASDNIVMFAERRAGAPRAIQVWYYPGDSTGEEFVYPRQQAMEIAKATHRSVLATNDERLANANAAKAAPVNRVDEKGATSPATPAASAARATPPAANTTAAASAAPKEGSVGTAGRTRLPRTASNLTAFEALSLLAFASALGVRQLRRRNAEAAEAEALS